MVKALELGQWVTHKDYRESFGRVMRATNPDMKGEPWFNYPFLSQDNGGVYHGQEEMNAYTTEVYVHWESDPQNVLPRRGWTRISHIEPAATKIYSVGLNAIITADIESPAEAKARDDVIEILTGAFRDSGWDILLRNSSVTEKDPAKAA